MGIQELDFTLFLCIGDKMSRRDWTNDEVKFLKKYYEDISINIKWLEEQLNRSEYSIRLKARRLGLFMRKNKSIYDICTIEECDNIVRSPYCKWCEMHYYRNRRNGDPEKLYFCQYFLNDNLYSQEWDDKKAWLLGVLWSDGYINGNSIGVKSKDIQLIESVKSVLETNVDIKECYTNKNRYYSISVASKKLASDLRDIGLYENKSLTIDYPLRFSLEFFGSFFRGLIDGDGCVCVYTPTSRKSERIILSLVSASAKLKNELSVILDEFGIKYSITVRGQYKKDGMINKPWNGNDIWRISICRYKSLKKLYSLMYPSFDVPCLHRKRDKFNKWIMRDRPKVGRPKKIKEKKIE